MENIDELRKRLNRAWRPGTPERSVASRIARRLRESGWRSAFLITRYVACVGIPTAQALCNRTLRIQKRGGVLLPDGSRRRTPGGVFLMLAKQSLPTDVRRIVFSRVLASDAPPPPQFQPPSPVQDRLQWDQRDLVIKRMIHENRVGTVTHVRCRMAVHATKVTPVDRLLLYEGTSASPLPPAMPRGSAARLEPPGPVRVLCTRQQAARIPDVPKDPTERMLLEGYPCVGADGQVLVLTRRIQSLNRLAAKPRHTWKEPWRRYLWATRGRQQLKAKLQKLGIEWKPPDRTAEKEARRKKEKDRRKRRRQHQQEVLRQQVERGRQRQIKKP